MTNNISLQGNSTGVNKKGIPLLTAPRVIRMKNKTRLHLVRIFTSILIITYFVTGVPAQAIGTTSASAIVIEDTMVDTPLSFSSKAPHPAKKDPCLSLLHTARLSPGADQQGSNNRHYQQANIADKQAASVALGLFLGVRVALGPKEVIKRNKRVQIGPEIHASNNGGGNYALAVASYRSCKNNHVLGLSRQK